MFLPTPKLLLLLALPLPLLILLPTDSALLLAAAYDAALLVVAALTVVAARGAPAWLPMAGVALAALIAGHVVGDLRARLERKRADGILDVLSQELHRRNEAHGRTHYALAIATGGQFHVANATFKTANLALAAYTYGDDCWVGDQEITPDELRYMAANEVPDVPEDARS